VEDINLRACALQDWNYASKQSITIKWNSIHDIRENRVKTYNIGREGRKDQLCMQIGMLDAFMEYEASANLE